MRGQGVGQKTWAFYLFHNLDQTRVKVARYEGLSDYVIRERISDLEATSYIVESDEEDFKAGTILKSFRF